jgi:hypothetical protein
MECLDCKGMVVIEGEEIHVYQESLGMMVVYWSARCVVCGLLMMWGE